jgi:hypothetical protein
MTLLQPMLEGALAAAELLALLLVPPAAAREPATPEARAALERPVQLHRLSTAGDGLPIAGRARLTDDERIADASGRTGPPVRAEADAPRAVLIDEDDGAFLIVVPHRAAARGTLVLRPASGEPETLPLGAIDTCHAVLVSLAGRAHLVRLADGAVELELADERGTWWTTLIVERVVERPALQTRGAE